MKIELLDRNKDLEVYFIGGKYNGQKMEVKDLINLSDFKGLSNDLSAYRDKGAWVHRSELDCIPKIEGYTFAWDNGTIRFETWEVYNSYFE